MAQVAVTRKALDTEQVIADVLGDRPYTIAVLDANRIVNLPELLEVAGLEHLCLFQGQLADEAAEVAPWIVRLERDDKFLQQLFASAGPDKADPFAFLELEAGIFFQTDMTLINLRRHLRRFMRVETQEGRAFLFRFWEPGIAGAYFCGLEGREDLIRRWFISREGGIIDAFVVPLPLGAQPELVQISSVDVMADAPVQGGQFKLTQGDVTRFGKVRMDRDIDKIAMRLTETFPETAKQVEGGDMHAFTRKAIARMAQFGFGKKAILFTLLAWDMHYGPQFEMRDKEGTLAQILTDPRGERARFEMLKTRMAQLD